MTQAAANTQMFDQGVQAIGEAVKAGVKIQEEIGKWWSYALEQVGSIQDWQKKSQAVASEVLPAAEKNTAEWFKVMEQNYKRGLELSKKSLCCNESAGDVQTRSRELFAAAVDTVRDNAQAIAQANVKAMETWAEVLRKSSNGHGAK